MKPDWQNKSFAKNGAVTGSSTMHSKLKVGTSSLHSKIAAANSNMPQAPKPAVRKFADGGPVTTRSDNQIWWESQSGNRGQSYPGDEVASKQYDARMAEGEKNMERLRSVRDSISSFFSKEDKASSDKTSSDNITNDKGGNKSDEAKAAIISAAMEKKPEASAVKTEEPSFKADVLKAVTAPKETKVEAAPAPAAPAPVTESAKPAPAPVAKPVAKKPGVKKRAVKAVVKPVSEPADKPAPPVSSASKSLNTSGRMTDIGQSQKDIEELIAKKKKDVGRKAAEDFNKLFRSR